MLYSIFVCMQDGLPPLSRRMSIPVPSSELTRDGTARVGLLVLLIYEVAFRNEHATRQQQSN